MSLPRRIWFAGWLGALAATLAAADSPSARACPFCNAVSQTFSEEIAAADAAVFAKLVKLPSQTQTTAVTDAAEAEKTRFEIVEILKGTSVLGKTRKIETIYYGDNPIGSIFLVTGIDPSSLNWSTPIAVTPRARDYISRALKAPRDGADRLAFFQPFLEDKEDMISRDAYDEFAKAPYRVVRDLRDRMNHGQLVEWVTSQQIPVSRRRLYLTMLGVCGTQRDLPMLEKMIKSPDRQTKGALDAMVAAYLTLKGPDGMSFIEDLFLKNKDAEYTDTYATIMALRFHGQEEDVVPKPRLLAGLRMMLDRPQLSDLVIPDLARWQDWSAIDKLVALFKAADNETSWVRVPVVNYLRACPLPEAKARLAELEKIDPEAVKRANNFFVFPTGAAAAPAPSKSGGDKPAQQPAASAQSAGNAAAPKLPPAEDSGSANPSERNNPTSTGTTTPPGDSASKAKHSQSRGKAAMRGSGRAVLGEIAAAARTQAAQGGHDGRIVVSGPQAVVSVMASSAALYGLFWVILRGGRRATA